MARQDQEGLHGFGRAGTALMLRAPGPLDEVDERPLLARVELEPVELEVLTVSELLLAGRTAGERDGSGGSAGEDVPLGGESLAARIELGDHHIAVVRTRPHQVLEREHHLLGEVVVAGHVHHDQPWRLRRRDRR